MKKIILIIILIISLSASAFGENKSFIIVYTNDWHGNILPNKDYKTPGEPKPVMGGASRLSRYLNQVRSEAKNNHTGVLLVDAGDIFHGTPEGNKYKGASIVEIMNAFQYDSVAVGNHEFTFGPDNLNKLAEKAKFPFLSCNIIKSPTNKSPDYLQPYLIKDIEGVKVAIIGVTAPGTKMMNFYENIAGLDFINPVIAVSRYISIAQENKADLIVVLSHLGYEEDKILAECLTQIDIIIGGHDHIILDPPKIMGKTIICQAGDNLLRAGQLNLVIDTKAKKITDYENKIVNLYQELYHPEPKIETLVDKYHDLDKDEIIGSAETTLYKNDNGEFPLGDWVTDVMRLTAGTDIALEPNGGIRGALTKGRITKRDLYCVSPFDNTVVTFKVNGRQIYELLESSLSEGGIQLQVSGLQLEYIPENPKGRRIINLEINGQKIDYNKYYTVSMNDFVVLGTKRYPQLKNLKELKDTGLTICEALVSYTKQNSPLKKSKGNRVIKRILETKTEKININTADEKTLMMLKGIGPQKARAIVEYRKKSGHFTCLEDIMEVKGIGPGIFRKIKPDICISEK